MLHGEAYLDSKQKRQLDVLSASAVALSLGIPAAVAGIAIRSIDRQPAIFRNIRLGQNWQSFEVFKLTTMQSDAHFYEKQWQNDKTDARVTNLGRIIRLLDLNEVPQTANIIRGDMHFIAARPVNEHVLTRLQDAEPSLFDEWHALYPMFKPGLVGPGQLAERSLVRCGDLLGASRSRMTEDINYWTNDASVETDLRVAMNVPMEYLAHILHSDEVNAP